MIPPNIEKAYERMDSIERMQFEIDIQALAEKKAARTAREQAIYAIEECFGVGNKARYEKLLDAIANYVKAK